MTRTEELAMLMDLAAARGDKRWLEMLQREFRRNYEQIRDQPQPPPRRGTESEASDVL